jgi:hypothetical protein
LQITTIEQTILVCAIQTSQFVTKSAPTTVCQNRVKPEHLATKELHAMFGAVPIGCRFQFQTQLTLQKGYDRRKIIL